MGSIKLLRGFTAMAAGLCLMYNCQALAGDYQLSYVYDGDTVKIQHDGGSFKLRLSDIDAPERNQSYGLKSRRALIALCQKKNADQAKNSIRVTIAGTDKYQRTLGKLSCNGIDASLYQVAHGLAWQYKQYSSDPVLRQAEQTARRDRLGLWADKEPTPPWVWRHLQAPNRQN